MKDTAKTETLPDTLALMVPFAGHYQEAVSCIPSAIKILETTRDHNFF